MRVTVVCIVQPSDLMSVDPLLPPAKTHVAMELEADARAPRKKNFRLPNGQVFWLSKLVDKYGEDFQVGTCYGYNRSGRVDLIFGVICLWSRVARVASWFFKRPPGKL